MEQPKREDYPKGARGNARFNRDNAAWIRKKKTKERDVKEYERLRGGGRHKLVDPGGFRKKRRMNELRKKLNISDRANLPASLSQQEKGQGPTNNKVGSKPINNNRRQTAGQVEREKNEWGEGGQPSASEQLAAYNKSKESAKVKPKDTGGTSDSDRAAWLKTHGTEGTKAKRKGSIASKLKKAGFKDEELWALQKRQRERRASIQINKNKKKNGKKNGG